MKTQDPKSAYPVRWLALLLILCGCLPPAPVLAGGTWSQVNQYSPDQVYLMLLLSDGRILCENNPEGLYGVNTGNTWLLLTPDNHGSYANGNWSYAQGANDSRLFFASQVLTNGKVFVAGGEYGDANNDGTARAEVYDPLTNGWAQVNPPTSLLNPAASQGFVDAESELLPNGSVLVTPVNAAIPNGTLIYNPNNNSWAAGPANLQSQSESSWVKLPDGSILTVDSGRYFTGTVNSERYIPSLNQWIADANTPVNLWANMSPGFVGETGPAFLLPNGKAFFLGGSGHTAIYTPSPSGGTNAGTWVQGPDIPGGLVCADSAGCMMNNGRILFDAAGVPNGTNGGYFPDGLTFFEYDYSAGPTGTMTQVSSPPNSGDFGTFETMMLAMPDGSVSFTQVQEDTYGADNNDTLYIYTPDGAPLAAGKPEIKSITMNRDGSYHLVGTGLNGISEGAAFGDDAQMNSNYPLVRFTDGSGNVYYGHTYNWSSTGVQTGTNLVTTEFTMPPSEPGGGSYSLVVVANGIASDPVTFDGPVWEDFNYSKSFPQMGTVSAPFSTLAQGTNAVASGGTISIKAGHSPETMTISKPMTITAFGGAAIIGQ